MNQVWLQIFLAMIGGNIVKAILPYSVVAVLIDVAVFAVCYMILRRYSNVDIRNSMLFLGLLTIISILTDLRIISEMLGSIVMLATVAWMIFKHRGNGGSGQQRRPIVRHKWHK